MRPYTKGMEQAMKQKLNAAETFAKHHSGISANSKQGGAEMNQIKKLTAGLVLGVLMLICAGKAAAEDRATKTETPYRAAAIIQKAGSLLAPLACNSHRALKLCAETPTTAFNFGIKKAKVAAAQPKGNKLFKIAQMFIDDMKVAEIGNWKVALKVEIE